MSERRKVVQGAAPEVTDPLHLKYRPKRLRDVLGQDAVVKSLEATMKAKARPHAFLFTGPAGTGKTTLARILAAEFGIEGHGIIEVDAATKNGVDDVRQLTDGLRYSGFGASPNKAIILNECQRLSAGAWDALLMTVEEPPPHAFFMFTSTHPAKIPKAMVTRCETFHLKALRFDDVMDVLERVCDEEGFDTPGRVLEMVAGACEGSMRAALTMLSKVHAMEDERDVADLLSKPLEDAEVIALCQALMDRRLTWERLVTTLKKMGDNGSEPEGIRIVICHYLAACLMPREADKDKKSGEYEFAKSDKQVMDILDTLDAFVRPLDPTVGRAALLHAFGRVMFS